MENKWFEGEGRHSLDMHLDPGECFIALAVGLDNRLYAATNFGRIFSSTQTKAEYLDMVEITNGKR